ncbi:MAG: threonine aldolase family protein [Actinomycetota bacterium]
MRNFYSDTQTRPTTAMLESVLTAEVGDEQRKADPTTLELERRVAALLGMEDAVFLPSGTMCNEIALRVHLQPGDEVICERSSHLICFEAGGMAAISGAMVHPIDGHRGTFTGDQVRNAVRPASRYMPRTRLVAVEQTANLAGGTVWPTDQIDEVAAAAREAGLATHLDGARLLNAVAASGVGADRYCRDMDSAWVDLTKGLGAPVGAVLAGSADFIEQAWRWKQQWGGALRQSGVLAAMGLHALDHHVDRLADDNAGAARIGETLNGLAGVANVEPVDTNIVIFDTTTMTAPKLVATAHDAGFDFGNFGPHRCRIVTHLGVDGGDVDALSTFLTSTLG